MAVNAEVQKSGSENVLSTIRKFSRRVQGTGLVKTARGQRYFERQKSKTVQKKRALKMLKRRADYQKAVKDGKVAEAPARGFRGNSAPRPQNDAPRSQSGLGDATPIAR
jgi:ribosomal protein S21